MFIIDSDYRCEGFKKYDGSYAYDILILCTSYLSYRQKSVVTYNEIQTLCSGIGVDTVLHS